MRIKLKVLLISRSPNEIESLLEELSHGGFDPVHKIIDTPDEMAESLRRDIWDAIIADYDLDCFANLEALRIIRNADLDIPLIYISDSADEESAVEAMISGAHDFLGKSKLARLPLAIQRALKQNVMRIDHKEAVRSLEKSERRLRTLVDSATQGIVIIQGGILKYLNPRMTEILGRENEGSLGKPFIEFIDAEDKELARAYYKKLLHDTRIDEPYVFRITRPDGEIRWLENYGVKVDWEGRSAKLIFLRDISKQKAAEEEVKKSSLIIEHKSIALKEVLSEIDARKDSFKRNLLTNVKESILPTLHRLKETSSPSQKKLFEILENELMNITSPFLNELKDEFAELSPRELEVCRLIKGGMTSKEIANVLGISHMTVHKHREVIRRKLNLVNDGSNLNTYLQTKFPE